MSIAVYYVSLVLMTSAVADPLTACVVPPQIRVPLIEQMPNLPQPYHLRDWKQVAEAFDRLVFDSEKEGQYVPLIRWATGLNRAGDRTFAIPSFVGDTRQTQEAITALGAINAASVAGIDKSKQAHNWVALSRYYFNDNENLNLYLNSRSDTTGASFWYELFPNILFYRIYAGYPDTPGMAEQFVTIADRWYAASVAMGGSDDPWSVPNFDHTAFDFKTFTPIDNALWSEPGSSAAIAWIQYMAYVKTGEPKYLTAAKWGMEFLDNAERNPWYEALFPHGVFLAARMNAEQGTDYDIEKLFNWCFDGSNRRRWGVTSGRWGDADCAGLVGSVFKGREYAFAMNTFNLANSLVPLVRYDPRFARSVGKWMLNAANSARYFYADQLPATHQTDADWAAQYDPAACLAYEGLRSEAVFVDRIQRDVRTRRGRVDSGNYRATIYTDRRYQVFEEEVANGSARLEHVWELAVSDAQYSVLNVVGKADADRACSILYAESPEGPFQKAATLNFRQNRTVSESVRLNLSADKVYLMIATEEASPQATKIYIDDVYLESFSGLSPFATGDAKSSNWGRTNFALYGSAFVGIFGGIIEKTNVEGILKLDCLATDYWRDDAYPTYLYYNPHPTAKTVELDLGTSSHSVYDTVSKEFLIKAASGRQTVAIPSDTARVLVFVPAEEAVVSKEDGKLFVNECVIDFAYTTINDSIKSHP